MSEEDNFVHVSLVLPSIIRSNLDRWDDLDAETVKMVKVAFVNMIPELAPAETLKMFMGKDKTSMGPDGTIGYCARFIGRKYIEASITPDKEMIWLLEY